jgi:plastocyanin
MNLPILESSPRRLARRARRAHLPAAPAAPAAAITPVVLAVAVLLLLVLAAAALLAGAPPLAAEELSGRVVLLAKDGKGPARGADPAQAVVYFEAEGAAHAPRAAKEQETPYQLLTMHKEFFPHVLAVPVGSRVQFPNQDPILHNVFSVSPGNAFDLGIYRVGPPKERRFDKAGVVRVYCNVHQAMVAYILVLDTSFFASPGTDGAFRLTGLPRGPGKLTVWHEQADPWSQEVTLPLPSGAPPVQARLVVLRPKLLPHLNKTGESYNRGDSYR